VGRRPNHAELSAVGTPPLPLRLEHVLILGMDYGLVLFTSDRGIAPAAAAKLADDHGFATFYVPEHTHIPIKRQAAHPTTGDESLPDDRYMRTLDPWVSLGTAAAVTSRVRLSTAVALPVEHDPITLAKSIATLDHLSGGRVSVGVGFGWNTDELEDHNVPPGRRRTMLREYLEAMRALWTEEEASYDGEFVKFGPSWAWPKPMQSHIPVLVGAAGTEKNFKWIARSADGWITTPRDFDIDEPVKLLQAGPREAGPLGRSRRDGGAVRAAGQDRGRGGRLRRAAGRKARRSGLALNIGLRAVRRPSSQPYVQYSAQRRAIPVFG
jgi:probable F420-dependent oxidoreductase